MYFAWRMLLWKRIGGVRAVNFFYGTRRRNVSVHGKWEGRNLILS